MALWIQQGSQTLFSWDVRPGVENQVTVRLHTVLCLKCSGCGMVTLVDESIRYDYCPHCGEKMEEEN